MYIMRIEALQEPDLAAWMSAIKSPVGQAMKHSGKRTAKRADAKAYERGEITHRARRGEMVPLEITEEGWNRDAEEACRSA
jgi:hypothetical protein